jgi:hypothetical protein
MSEEHHYPELVLVCPSCNGDIPIPHGAYLPDVLWLHERRCQAFTYCNMCERHIAIPTGHTPAEALWLHEPNCPAARPGDLLWAS